MHSTCSVLGTLVFHAHELPRPFRPCPEGAALPTGREGRQWAQGFLTNCSGSGLGADGLARAMLGSTVHLVATKTRRQPAPLGDPNWTRALRLSGPSHHLPRIPCRDLITLETLVPESQFSVLPSCPCQMDTEQVAARPGPLT